MSQSAAPAIFWPDAQRWLRYGYRVPLLVWHLAVDLPLVLLMINPLTARTRIAGERVDYWAIRLWQGGLMRVFGFRVSARGTPHPGACLSVANHISWLDITLLHSQRVVHFVAKDEISRWPLIGWMARRAGTIYHRRGSTDSLTCVAQVMVERMRAGESVGVFPEGGTSSNFTLRTFHPRIFQPALDAGVAVQPIALRFLRDGVLADSVPFQPNERFITNFFRLLGEPGGEAEVHFLPLVYDTGAGRRALAQNARHAIAHCVHAGE